MNPVCPYQRHRESAFLVFSPIPGGKPGQYSPASAISGGVFQEGIATRAHVRRHAPKNKRFSTGVYQRLQQVDPTPHPLVLKPGPNLKEPFNKLTEIQIEQ